MWGAGARCPPPPPTGPAGRLPAGPSEVALGALTMKTLDGAVGALVTATTVDGSEVALTVVGTVALPPQDVSAIDDGAVLSPDGFDAVLQADEDNGSNQSI